MKLPVIEYLKKSGIDTDRVAGYRVRAQGQVLFNEQVLG